MALAVILLVPAVATLWTAWEKFSDPAPPAPLPLSLAGAGALVVNLICAFMLARFRHHAGSLTRAAFLSARNDAIANIAIVGAGLLTAATLSAWPDLNRRSWHRCDQRRCRAGGVHGRAAGTGCGSLGRPRGP
jgi:Co/Zn/Cd efflux system component